MRLFTSIDRGWSRGIVATIALTIGAAALTAQQVDFDPRDKRPEKGNYRPSNKWIAADSSVKFEYVPSKSTAFDIQQLPASWNYFERTSSKDWKLVGTFTEVMRDNDRIGPRLLIYDGKTYILLERGAKDLKNVSSYGRVSKTPADPKDPKDPKAFVLNNAPGGKLWFLPFAEGNWVDTPAPFFVMGHHANSLKRVNEYVGLGANVIEHDIHCYSSLKSIYIIHFATGDAFTGLYTNSDGIDAYYQNIKQKMDSGQVLGIVCDIKNTLVSDGPRHVSLRYPDPKAYGKLMAGILQKNQIPADKVIIGVSDTTAFENDWFKNFKSGVVDDAKYPCLFNAYLAINDASKWADRLAALSSDVADVGLDERVRGNFDGYRPFLQEIATRRDKLGRLFPVQFTYFWTVNNKDDMRSALRLGVNGFITDDPKMAISVVTEPEFSTNYRIAVKGDPLVPPK